MNNQPSKERPEIIIVAMIILYFILLALKQVNVVAIVIILMIRTQKCVPDVVKDLNVKLFNLMCWTNEIKNIKWHETCKCECRLDAIVCNNKQRWNKNKCRCECKELINKSVCDKGFIWNPSNCECECNKSCDFSE